MTILLEKDLRKATVTIRWPHGVLGPKENTSSYDCSSAANHEIAESNSKANSSVAVRLNILLGVSACQFFNLILAWKEKHAIRTCIFKDWNPGGGEGWKALLLCTASWNQTQIKADFSQECEALSDGWIPHISHLHHQIPASVSTFTGYHTAVPTATSALETEKSLEHTRQVTQLCLPLAYAKSLSPFKFQPHFIFQTENRVQARTFLYVQHLLLFPHYQTCLADQSQKTYSILQLSTPLWSQEKVALRQQQISQSASSCASRSSVFIRRIR